MDKSAKLYIVGHTGLLGIALYKRAIKKGYENIVVRRHNKLDLTNQE